MTGQPSSFKSLLIEEAFRAEREGQTVPAPGPLPATARDLVRARALLLGYDAMTAEGPALSSFASFKAGVETFELVLAQNGRAR